MREVKAVFFDVANTLLHKPKLFKKIKYALSLSSIHIEEEELIMKHKLLSEIVTFPDKTSREFYASFNSELLYLLGIPPTKGLTDSIFEECSYLPWQPYDDTTFINAIPQKKGILSNWDITLEDQLQKNFSTEFTWILGSQNTGIRKPNPFFFDTLIQKTGYDPGEILYVGDSLKLDIVPALQAGFQAVLIDRLDLFRLSPVNRIKEMSQLESYL